MTGAVLNRAAGVPLTMSSREIAELTGKEHDNVRRDIKNLGVALSLTFEEKSEPSDGGRPSLVLMLPKRETLILISGYNVELRARIIDRWQELEAQQAPAVPQSLSQALRLAADQAEQIEQQAAALALAAPKVEYVDRYVAANGSKGFREVAKLLQANEHEFRAFLEDAKILYRLGGAWAAYQQHIEAGRFVTRTGVSQVNDHAYSATKFTPKGVQWIAGLWGQQQARKAQGGEA